MCLRVGFLFRPYVKGQEAFLLFRQPAQYRPRQRRDSSRNMLVFQSLFKAAFRSHFVWVSLLYRKWMERTCIPLVNSDWIVSLRGVGTTLVWATSVLLVKASSETSPKFLCSKFQCCQFRLHFSVRPWAAAQRGWGWCSSKHRAGGSAVLPGLSRAAEGSQVYLTHWKHWCRVSLL